MQYQKQFLNYFRLKLRVYVRKNLNNLIPDKKRLSSKVAKANATVPKGNSFMHTNKKLQNAVISLKYVYILLSCSQY